MYKSNVNVKEKYECKRKIWMYKSNVKENMNEKEKAECKKYECKRKHEQ